MHYMLDTNVCVDYLNGRYPNVIARVHACHPEEICVSAVAVAELRYGADHSAQRKRNHARLDVLLGEIRCVAFDQDAARVFGRMRAQLEKEGRLIGPYDMQIAAHALHLSVTLVTDNVAEFARVKDLKFENWRLA